MEAGHHTLIRSSSLQSFLSGGSKTLQAQPEILVIRQPQVLGPHDRSAQLPCTAARVNSGPGGKGVSDSGVGTLANFMLRSWTHLRVQTIVLLCHLAASSWRGIATETAGRCFSMELGPGVAGRNMPAAALQRVLYIWLR